MLHGSKRAQAHARRFRSEMSLPEVLLWQALRLRPGGMKFRRQHPAGPYVLDFFCASTRLAIEVDGEAHNRDDRPERDRERDVWLETQALTVLRIPGTEILADIETVVRHIIAKASPEAAPLHHPSDAPPPLMGEERR